MSNLLDVWKLGNRDGYLGKKKGPQPDKVNMLNKYNKFSNDNKITNKIIADKSGKVFNVNSQGVATYFKTPRVYNVTSGKRGVPGTGNYSNDISSIQKVGYDLDPTIFGYDTNSGLFLNGNVRPGQSNGDEMKNVFAGLKSPIEFDYKGCIEKP
jgi:hypothetical protein